MSGYRAWTHGGTPDRMRLTEAQRLALIRASLEALMGAYGSPRLVKELRGHGVTASTERVEQLSGSTASVRATRGGIRSRRTRRPTDRWPRIC